MPLCAADTLSSEFDVCVTGAGPAGLACALDLHDRGLRVLLLDAGGDSPLAGESDLLAAEILYPAFHDPVEIVAASALGGSTHWWGGRTMRLDPVDFRAWPLAYDEMLPWWDLAEDFLGSRGASEAPPPPAFGRLQRFEALGDERWGAQLNMARRWRARIRQVDGPAIVTCARVVELIFAEGKVVGARVRAQGEEHVVKARRYVLACGGLGGLRLLLLAQRSNPGLFGGAAGPLGRGYMGHLTGTIAQLAPAEPRDAQAFFTRPLGDGRHARRRLRPTGRTVQEEGMLNIAFWLENAVSADPAHGSAAASARYLAASMLLPRRWREPLRPHLENVARAPLSAAGSLLDAGLLLAWARIAGRHPRQTRLTPAAPGAWRLDYHAEQPPDAANRISLADTVDSIGLPKLRIDFRIRSREVEGVVRAHELLDADLRAAGAGSLRFFGSREDRLALVLASSRDGYHQLGGVVMSANPATGVVDANLRAHGIENLWVVSGSVLPSGGQANPTLTVVALARRLADHIARARADVAAPAAASQTAVPAA